MMCMLIVLKIAKYGRYERFSSNKEFFSALEIVPRIWCIAEKSDKITYNFYGLILCSKVFSGIIL